jgi:Fic family protein
MQLEIIQTNLLKPFEKQVKASVNKCFKDLEESDFSVQDFKHYMLASAVASSQIEGSTLDLNSFFQSKANNTNTKEVKEIEDLLNAYPICKTI